MERNEQIVSRYVSGESTIEIAAALNLSRARVYQILKEQGVMIKNPQGAHPVLHSMADVYKNAAWMQIEVQPNGCWYWMGIRLNLDLKHKDVLQYGVINVGKKLMRAHRLVWQYVHQRPVPKGKQLLHTCDTPWCVNPDCTYPGTHLQNMQDKSAKGRHWQQQKTHCPQGHPYDAENTRLILDKTRGTYNRKCRTCSCQR